MKIADFRPWVITTHRQLADAVKEILGAIPWHNAIQPTLSAPKVPIVLHEPAILAGYRIPYKSWSYYFLSLFQIHNETVNVWSHLIGSLVILHKLYGYFHEFDIYTDDVLTVLLVFGISCVICLLTSAVVHLLHGKSPYVHFVAFCIDYIGATFGSFGAGYACFYGLSDEGFYKSFDNIFLYLLTIASYLNCLNLFLAKIWYGHDPHNMKRKYLFIGGMLVQALMNMAPFVPRYFTCYNDETCSMTSLNHLTTLTIVFILEAITFSAHQPEKRWPGKFDIVGHGHQMFHLLIVFNHAVILDSIRQDHVDGLTSHKETNLVIALGIMATMYVLDLVTLYLLSPLIPESLRKIKHAEAVAIKSQ